MKIGVKKRGLSPVIASVLLILIVVTMVSMVFVWARGFVSDRTEENELSSRELCEAVSFNAMFDETEGILEIVNKGNVDIDGFEVKIYSGGDSAVIEVSASIIAGESVRQNVDLGDLASFDKVEIFPMLSGRVSKKSFTCHGDPVFLVGF